VRPRRSNRTRPPDKPNDRRPSRRTQRHTDCAGNAADRIDVLSEGRVLILQCRQHHPGEVTGTQAAAFSRYLKDRIYSS
jgi:hypothetical protein